MHYSVSSQAGVVAAAGEEAKDDRYLETVSGHGGEFIPLASSYVSHLVSGHPLLFPSFL